jgi:hypothetical protein
MLLQQLLLPLLGPVECFVTMKMMKIPRYQQQGKLLLI